MTTKKFNCTFSVRETVEKTYVVTNLPVKIPEEDLDDMSPQALKDIASDIIRTFFHDGILTLDECTIIQTDTGIDVVNFVMTPKEIKED